MDRPTFHETLIEKILHSGKYYILVNRYGQCLPNYDILKIQRFFQKKGKKRKITSEDLRDMHCIKHY